MHRVLGGIFVSSVEPLSRKENLLETHGITHILSVLSNEIPNKTHYETNYTCKWVCLNDEETSNILQYIPECNNFIDSCLASEGKHGSRILIHCLQGCSRSTTIAAAYLMKRHKLTADQAVYAIRRKHPSAEPNASFLEQLRIYDEIKDLETPLKSQLYTRWNMEHSFKSDPTGRDFIENDSNFHAVDESAKSTQLRCKRCRSVLASSKCFIEHSPPDEDSKQSRFVKTAYNSRRIVSSQEASLVCSHYFVEPLNWMKEEFSKGNLEGKLLCFKCQCKVGAYSWQGSRCSCGRWMVPAIHFQVSKVDQMKVR